MKKKILIILSLFCLTSCSSKMQGYIRYGIKNPYIELETSSSSQGELINILPSKVEEKIANADTFMLYIHSSYCESCKISEEKFLTPYLETHPVIIYGIDRVSFSAQEEIDTYLEIISSYKDLQGTPYYALYQSGIFINGEQDSSYFSLFFSTYII